MEEHRYDITALLVATLSVVGRIEHTALTLTSNLCQ